MNIQQNIMYTEFISEIQRDVEPRAHNSLKHACVKCFAYSVKTIHTVHARYRWLRQIN